MVLRCLAEEKREPRTDILRSREGKPWPKGPQKQLMFVAGKMWDAKS